MRGGERQLLYLACALRARGHDNTVVCRRDTPLEREAARLDLPVLRLPFWGEWDPVSAALLRRAAERGGKPAILHAHSGHTAALAFLAGQAGGPPAVVHRRVDFPLSGLLARKLKYESAGRVIAVSEAIAALLRDDGVPAERIVTVPDAVPVGAEEARLAGVEPLGPADPSARAALRARLGAEWKTRPDVPWIGNVAALVPHKDQANFLRAAAFVRKARPEAVFWLVGDGPLRAELEALAGALGMADAVRFVGYQPSADWLRCFDAFVLSSWGEGMGSVLLEAMACGAPIAATTAGGIPELVSSGRNGLLVPPRDGDALGAAILRLLENPALAAVLVAGGVAALPRFGLSRNAEAIEAVYAAVAPFAGRPPRSPGVGRHSGASAPLEAAG